MAPLRLTRRDLRDQVEPTSRDVEDPRAGWHTFELSRAEHVTGLLRERCSDEDSPTPMPPPMPADAAARQPTLS